jgi:hypothetical protein
MIRNLVSRASIYTLLIFIVTMLLTIGNTQEHDWFLGKWIAYRGFDVYTLENYNDSTYTFTINTDGYVETGTWQLEGDQFTQNWNDPNIDEATSATYDLEKLSDTAFKQSGGNLSEGTVFAYAKVIGETETINVPTLEVSPQSYSCFSSTESFVDTYADETDIMIELRSDESYTTTSPNFNDEGTFSAKPITQDVFTRYLPLEFFPNASLVQMKSSNGNLQTFIFARDAGGNSYLFQTDDMTYLRCQAEEAEVEAVLEEASNAAEILVTQGRAVTSGRVPTLTPLAEVVPGTYQCSYSYDDYNIDTGAHEPKPFEKVYSLELFAGNQYICTSDGGADGCDDIDKDNIFSLSTDGALTWLDGDMEIYYDDKFSRYGQDANSTPTLVMYEEDDDPFTGNWLYHVYHCPRVGDTTTPSPAEQATAEYQLLPATTVAPSPPAGAGGLEGLFMYYSGQSRLELQLGSGGMLTSQLVGDPPEYKYFLPDGYVYHGIYDWSYEDLDCSRVKKDNTPLCDTYLIDGNTINFGNGESFSFERKDNDLIMDEKSWWYQEPAPEGFRLEGTFENTSGYGGMFISSSFYTFDMDGTFSTDRSSALTYSTPDMGGSQTFVTGYNEEATNTGTYTIRGNTIEFSFNDGTVAKRTFAYSLTDTQKVDSIYLNGTVFWK